MAKVAGVGARISGFKNRVRRRCGDCPQVLRTTVPSPCSETRPESVKKVRNFFASALDSRPARSEDRIAQICEDY